ERITKKRTKNKAKTTKPGTEWKSDQMGPQSMTTAHLRAIDRDYEDFEGPDPSP
ncbi:hypothetical protein Tco_0263773, partial [Tanacetum coccineum]